MFFFSKSIDKALKHLKWIRLLSYGCSNMGVLLSLIRVADKTGDGRMRWISMIG